MLGEYQLTQKASVLYQMIIPDIKPKDANTVYTVQVFLNGEAVSGVAEYSLAGWAKEQTGKTTYALAMAIMRYGMAAAAM